MCLSKMPRRTCSLLQKIEGGEPPTVAEKTRYRHPQVKVALVTETNGKCAYCESKLLHIHHGDVEHIYPKSLAPERTFEWSNLTLACEVCNQNKSDRDPYVKSIIDPYGTDPADHLLFSGPLVFSRGTALGTATRAILDLNRGELAERRKEQLDRLMAIYESMLRMDVPLQAKKAIYNDLRAREGSASAPYTAMARAVIQQMREFLPEGVE